MREVHAIPEEAIAKRVEDILSNSIKKAPIENIYSQKISKNTKVL